MTPWQQAALGVGIALSIFALFVAALYIADAAPRHGRWPVSSQIASSCFGGLLGDPRISRARKLLIIALIGYLAMPLDLVPDFIPVAGQLDDVLLVALVLRMVLRGAGSQIVREHWPGSADSLRVILRLAHGTQAVG